MISVVRPFRVLQKHWKLAAIAVFSLSIAMALGVLSLSLINNFLFVPPAGQNPDRLVVIHAHTPETAIEKFSYLDYRYYRENNHVFTDVAAMPEMVGISFTSNSDARMSVATRPVSDNYFDVLGVRPLMGRLFAPGDDRSPTSLAVMTYSCWQRLGGDPNILGKNISGSTIIGVTPREFVGSMWGVNADLLTSLPHEDAEFFAKRKYRAQLLLARLKPGVTRRQALAEMTTLSKQLAAAYPEDDKDLTAVINRATMLPPDAIPDAELSASILAGLVLLVLLIACTNVANLLLAIAVGRRQEAAIKLALGAQRGRLIREFLRESAIICGSGAALGYGLAAVVLRRYPSISLSVPMVGTYSISFQLRLDATVAALTIGLTLVAILATGLAPALYASSRNVTAMLGGEIVVGGMRKKARRNVLVTAQVAVCTLSLVGAGLCQRSLLNVRRSYSQLGLRNLITLQVGLPQGTEAQRKEFFSKIKQAVSALGGIESVSFANRLAIFGGDDRMQAQADAVSNKFPVANDMVEADYFDTVGIQIVSGRAFNQTDGTNAQKVAVINRKMADTFWPGKDAVDKSFLAGDPPERFIVVGIIENGKYASFDGPAPPMMYSALSQLDPQGTNVVARTAGDPHLWVNPLRQAVRSVGIEAPALPVTFEEWENFDLLTQRIVAGSVAVLSSLGLLLAALGLLGAVSYSVSERRKELGIRVALGAQRRQLMQMILYQTLWITGTGVAIGIMLGIGVAIALRSQFYGVSAVEWRVLLPVSAGVIGVSLAVAYISARPWLAVDPLEAVHHS